MSNLEFRNRTKGNQQIEAPPILNRVRQLHVTYFISLETNDMIIHNVMVNYGATHNIMNLLVMRTIDLDYSINYEVGECIIAID